MVWANFLHIFQPAHQLPDILERIVNESYRPLMKGFLARPKAKLILNINAGLAELLIAQGYGDIIEAVTTLAERGQLEFLESAAYHAFLPMLPEAEIRQQIALNKKINTGIFGKVYQPTGFFAPEMAYSEKVGKIADELGYRYYLLDEIAFNGRVEQADLAKIFTLQGTSLKILFRNRRISNLIMGAVVRNGETFIEALGEAGKEDFKGYILTAMDGETFGHHRPGLDKLLFEIYESKKIQPVLSQDLLNMYPAGGEIAPIASTWACSADDIARGAQFNLWNDPENEIHRLQWELADLALEAGSFLTGELKRKHQELIQDKLDRALDSGQFWWASANPWWSLEEIERGAWNLLEVVEEVDRLGGRQMEKVTRARQVYQKIISMAFDYQRTGRMRKIIAAQKSFLKIPVKERDPAEYKAAVEILRREEKNAVQRGEYEQAIKWRDAAYKLENGLDIYDTVSIIDQLRAQNRHQDFEQILEKYREEFRNLQSGQPE